MVRSVRRPAASWAWGWALGWMAWVGPTSHAQLVLHVDPATVAWDNGVDLVVKVSLENQGGPIGIVSGMLYVDVVGTNAPLIQDIKVAGAPGSAQYVAGTFLAGGSTAGKHWTQQPLQTSDPTDPSNTVGNFQATALGVAYFTPSMFTEEIPGHASAPFAEITLRRGAGQGGSWSLNLFWSDPWALSYMDLSGGPYDPADDGKVFMGPASATVTAVPEPGAWGVATGLAMACIAWRRHNRTSGLAMCEAGGGITHRRSA